jgi:hypothetical protein
MGRSYIESGRCGRTIQTPSWVALSQPRRVHAGHQGTFNQRRRMTDVIATADLKFIAILVYLIDHNTTCTAKKATANEVVVIGHELYAELAVPFGKPP